MSYFRSLAATLLSAALSFGLATASGCGTPALGVDDCRDIEQARCRAAEPCGIVSDVPACERYYRDHCLHGLPAKPTTGGGVAACVQVIEAAGRCAKADPTSSLSDCEEEVTAPKPGFTTACDVVVHPERTPECSFLTDLPDDNDGSAGQSAGGQSGAEPDDETESSSGGAGGQGAQGGAAVE